MELKFYTLFLHNLLRRAYSTTSIPSIQQIEIENS